MFSVKKIWQLQLQVSNICHINNMFRTRSLSLMYCVNLAEFTHISLLLTLYRADIPAGILKHHVFVHRNKMNKEVLYKL